MIPFSLNIAAVVLALSDFGATAMAALTGSEGGQQAPSGTRQTSNDNFSPVAVISAIRFQGNDTVSSEKIIAEIATRVGEHHDTDEIGADVNRLLETLLFCDVRTHCREEPRRSGKYVLTFFLHEMPQTVPKIEYRDRKSITLQEIENLTGLKSGRPADRVRTHLAVNQIRRLYLEKGYVRVSVAPLVECFPGDTKVVIEIFEGPRPRLRSIAFEGNRFASDRQLMTKMTTKRAVWGQSSGSNFLAQIIDERKQPIPYDLIKEDMQKMTDY
jgi:outer membrane protein insertion porin family